MPARGNVCAFRRLSWSDEKSCVKIWGGGGEVSTEESEKWGRIKGGRTKEAGKLNITGWGEGGHCGRDKRNVPPHLTILLLENSPPCPQHPYTQKGTWKSLFPPYFLESKEVSYTFQLLITFILYSCKYKPSLFNIRAKVFIYMINSGHSHYSLLHCKYCPRYNDTSRANSMTAVTLLLHTKKEWLKSIYNTNQTTFPFNNYIRVEFRMLF